MRNASTLSLLLVLASSPGCGGEVGDGDATTADALTGPWAGVTRLQFGFREPALAG